ncbi:MAG: hypothetical protein IKH86_06980 [Prevotella sp.]|nr:hypothetical protein [Prevotella sp.]
MKPIGGYFSLEVNNGCERHHEAIRLNAGRYALEYIIKARKYTKVYLPYYICDSVLQPFKRLGVDYEFYHINKQLEPVTELQPKDKEAVLYVNYFGLKNRKADSFSHLYRNTILDCTQAFYCECGNKYYGDTIQCDTFYSCRKYFGVPDGAYLYTNCLLDEELPQDESFERMAFLTKRIDRSPQEGYADFHANDKALGTVGLRRMSKLTEAMMHSIDYTAKANRRLHNFLILDEVLRDSNRFKWEMNKGDIPLVYPYFVENGAGLRQYLINHQVFCARYWPNVLEWCQPKDLEYLLAENLVCLPIDQRYDDNDMQLILDLLSSY